MCVAPYGPSNAPTMYCFQVTMLRNNYHVTNTGPAVIPTKSVDKRADNELRSKTTARYFISIQVRYSLVQFGA